LCGDLLTAFLVLLFLLFWSLQNVAKWQTCPLPNRDIPRPGARPVPLLQLWIEACSDPVLMLTEFDWKLS
jgi:hypothetical protein